MEFDRSETYRVMSKMEQVGYEIGKNVAKTTSPTKLSETQMLALDDMVERRIANTDDTRNQAIQHIINYLKQNDNNNK